MNQDELKKIVEKININDELLEENKLTISDLNCTEFKDINLMGNIKTNSSNINKAVVIGAYIIHDDQVKHVSATSFRIKKEETKFLLTIDDQKIDKIYLYAEILKENKETKQTVTTPKTNENVKPNPVKTNPTPIQTKPQKKKTLLERVKDSIEIDEKALNELGIKFDKINVVRKYANVDFTIFYEVQVTKKLNKHGKIFFVLYDHKDEILDSTMKYYNLSEFNGMDIIEQSFEVNPAQIETIKIFPQFGNLLF